MHIPPADHGIVAVDVETTGLGHNGIPPREDVIIEVGAAWRAGGQMQTWSMLCDPGSKWFENGHADKALRINGLSKESISKAPSSRLVAEVFCEELLGQLSICEHGLLAYHRAFERGFLSQEPWLLPEEAFGPCLMVAAARKVGYVESAHLALWKACQRLGIVQDSTNTHSAAHDAEVAYLVWEALGKPWLPTADEPEVAHGRA